MRRTQIIGTIILALAAAVGTRAQAPLPAFWSGPWSIPAPTGWTFSGLGTPYASNYDGVGSTAGKLDNAGDYVSVNFAGEAASVSYWLRGNPASGIGQITGVFQVTESADGTNWALLAGYTNLSSNVIVRTNAVSASARHVRFLYVSKISGNVGLDGVSVSAAGPIVPATNVQFALAAADLAESAGAFTVTVFKTVAQGDVTGQVARSGTATEGQDYAVSMTNFVLAGAQTAATLVVTVADDALVEAAETITLSLTGLVGATTGSPAQCTLTLFDNDSPRTNFLVMAANLSSQTGACATEYSAPGMRILQGLRPDVCAIQEWNVPQAGGRRQFVDELFGTNFSFMVEPTGGDCEMPNGIISRWPILASGEWNDVEVPNRDFAWATIQIPADRPLHVVSVHLKAGSTSDDVNTRIREARTLTNLIAAAFPASDYVVLAGDLNTADANETTLDILRNLFAAVHQPADQNGNRNTNIPRSAPYDHVLANPTLDTNHAAVTLGGLTFAHGVVFDSRLWASPPSPIQTTDSAAGGIQHLAVMKRFGFAQVRTPPYLTAIGSRAVALGNPLEFTVTALPTDGDAVTLAASNVPTGATFAATNGNGAFTWAAAGPAGVYTMRVEAADVDGVSAEDVAITVMSVTGVPVLVWINEINYDTPGTDSNEFVEVAGPAGVDLSPYTLVLYNGSGGAPYATLALSGVLTNERCGFGAAAFDTTGIQNGAPDGLALVSNGTTVVQFLSYEGAMTAASGPAQGLTSTDIGTQVADGSTLQLAGIGDTYGEFRWTNTVASPGSLNVGQAIEPCGAPGDQDGDGLPDAWELAHGLNPAVSNGPEANADGDWLTDAQEYVADTEPTNPASCFGFLTVASGWGVSTVLVQPTSTSRIYDILWTENPGTPPVAAGLTRPGTGSNLVFLLTNSPPQRFHGATVRRP